MTRYIILDTETTGLEVFQGHRIIDLACVEVFEMRVTGREFQVYLNPERLIDAASIEVHGISDSFVKDKPKFAHIANDFLDFIAGSTLVIHNAKFDLGFLNAELNKVGLPKISNNVLDTVNIAKRQYPGQPASLDSLCQRFGISLQDRTKHGALLDSRLLAQVFIRMIQEGATDLMIDKFLQSITLTKHSRPQNTKYKVIYPKETELNHHKQSLKALPLHFWGDNEQV